MEGAEEDGPPALPSHVLVLLLHHRTKPKFEYVYNQGSIQKSAIRGEGETGIFYGWEGGGESNLNFLQNFLIM